MHKYSRWIVPSIFISIDDAIVNPPRLSCIYQERYIISRVYLESGIERGARLFINVSPGDFESDAIGLLSRRSVGRTGDLVSGLALNNLV